MPRILCFFLLLTYFHSVAQDATIRIGVKGEVLFKNRSLAGVHIVNKSSLEETITDANGEFRLIVKLGDLIAFSALNYEMDQLLVDLALLENKRVVIDATLKIIKLNEVVVSDGFVPDFGDIKAYDFVEDQQSAVRNSTTAGQFQNGIDIIGLAAMGIKAIFGSKKRIKETAFIDKPKFSSLLLQVYDSSYIVQHFNIHKDSVYHFLYFCDLQKYPDDIFRKENEFTIIDFLHSTSEKFNKPIVNED